MVLKGLLKEAAETSSKVWDVYLWDITLGAVGVLVYVETFV